MTVTTFDTLAYFEKLKAAGVSEQQAKVQADALHQIFDENIATKSDILILQKDMLALENRLTVKLGAMLIGAISIIEILVRIGH